MQNKIKKKLVFVLKKIIKKGNKHWTILAIKWTKMSFDSLYL